MAFRMKKELTLIVSLHQRAAPFLQDKPEDSERKLLNIVCIIWRLRRHIMPHYVYIATEGGKELDSGGRRIILQN